MMDSCTYVAGNSSSAAVVTPSAPFDLVTAEPSDWAFVGLPANGQVFKWTPVGSVSNVNEMEVLFAGVKVYPTVLNDKLTIAHDGQMVHATLTDVNGRALSTYSLESKTSSIDVSGLGKGIYLLTVSDKENRSKTYKVVK